MILASFMRENAPVLLLAGAAAGWYAASHAAASVLAGGALALRRRIIGHWIPIFVTAVLAILAGQPDAAVGVLFATSVAALSLVLGIVTLGHEFGGAPTAPGGFAVPETAAPNVHIIGGSGEPPAVQWRRLWAFVLPAAVLALLAGFSGELTSMHALALLAEGLVILVLWSARRSTDALTVSRTRWSGGAGLAIRVIELLLAVAVAGVAAWAGLRAARDMSTGLGLISAGFVIAVLVAPALVLPMIGTGMAMARSNLYHAAITSSVSVVLLNLCFGLPAIIGIWYSQQYWSPQVRQAVAVVTPTGIPRTTVAAMAEDAEASEMPALRYPLAVWRIDTVILILLGLVLLPLAVGRWEPGPFEGIMLIVVYVIYMGLTTLAARA